MSFGNAAGAGLQEAMNSSVLAGGRGSRDYVVYKRKKHFLSEALFYVKYEDRTYAVLPVDEITVTSDEQLKDLELIGYVYKARSEENDLTDTPVKETTQKYAIYKLNKTLYVQVPKSDHLCAPMIRVN